jgi:hypothetical protein
MVVTRTRVRRGWVTKRLSLLVGVNDLVGGSGLFDNDNLGEKRLLDVDFGVKGRLVARELLLDVLVAESDLTVSGSLLGRPDLTVSPELLELATDRGGDDEANDHAGDGDGETGEVVGGGLEDVLVERGRGREQAERDELGEEPRAESGGEVGLVKVGGNGRATLRDDDTATEELGEARAGLDDLENDSGGDGRVLGDVVVVVETVRAGDL